MSNLFKLKDVRTNPGRDGFDLSSHLAFSAKTGELLPVYWKFTMPGDKFNLQVQHFTRTAPLQSAAYVRIKEHFDWFFVPLRLLWKSFESSITLMQNNPVQAKSATENLVVSSEMPYQQLGNLLSLSGGVLHQLWGKNNYFGFNRAILALKLFNHLGYCNIPDDYLTGENVLSKENYYGLNTPVTLFPLFAYQKIYTDYFRNGQWENANPYLYNVDYSEGGNLGLPNDSDYWNNETPYDLHYCNYPKDLYMGTLPNSQYGDVAEVQTNFPNGVTVPVNIPASTARTSSLQGIFENSNETLRLVVDTAGDPPKMNLTAIGGGTGIPVSGNNIRAVGQTTAARQVNITLPDNIVSSFNILQLRMQQSLQRWKEVSLSGSPDFRSQVKKHFDVDLPPEMSDMCTFIDGDTSALQISEVVNQSFGESEDDAPYIKGKGVGTGDGRCSFYTKEYGVLMCIYHSVPVIDYAFSGIDLGLLKTEAYDFAMPEFDRIGLQELPFLVMNNVNPRALGASYDADDSFYTKTVGYVPRYIDYKTSVDRVTGDFNVSRKDWVAPLDYDYIQANIDSTAPVPTFDITSNFMKVSPHLLDNIFATTATAYTNTDQFLVNAFFDVKAVRNLDYSGMPY